MPERRHEVRVTGRLSEVAKAAVAGADVAEVAAERVISGLVRHGHGLHQFLAAHQSLVCASCPSSWWPWNPRRGEPVRPGTATLRS